MISVNSLKRSNTFVRFLMVGAVNTLIGLSIIFILLNHFGWSYWLATFIGNSVGAAVSYVLNRSFTFNSGIGVGTGVPKFILIVLICYLFSYSFSGMAARLIMVPEWVSRFVSADELGALLGTSIYTLTNYLGQKVFVFRRRLIG